MAGPLAGYRILDLTTMISGPFATMILGDQGADVIKIEMPGRGDQVRHAGNKRAGLPAVFLNNNRNKRSITIDLKSQEGVDVLKRLTESADVLIQNFRPGVVDRMGIGEHAMRAVNPSLIYVSISGFGERGPYAGKPVYDPIIQAASGLASIQGGSDKSRPRLVRTIVPDKVTALTAAQAVTAALLARERSGKGQHLRLSMLGSVLAFLWSSDMGGQTFVGESVSEQRAASFIDLIYETKDGHMSVAVMSDAQWAGLTRALERPEWLEDPRFETMALRDLNIDERLSITQEVLRTRGTKEWMTRLEAEGVPCIPVLTRNEVVGHPQVLENNMLVETDHPDAGRIRQARSPVEFAATPAEIRRGAPKLAEHSEEILRELGFAADQVDALMKSKIVGG